MAVARVTAPAMGLPRRCGARSRQPPPQVRSLPRSFLVLLTPSIRARACLLACLRLLRSNLYQKPWTQVQLCMLWAAEAMVLSSCPAFCT